MKSTFALFLSTAGLLHAGSPDLETTIAPKPEPWIKPLIDIRARYEFGNVSPLDDSNSLSVRERLGFKTAKWNGLSLLAEGEFTQVAGSDSNAGAGKDVYPFDPKNTPINDPRNAELNQAYVQYEGFDTTLQVGRAKIIYDNASFVGNVGWRQNEQTFDAITLANKSIEGLTLKAAYIDQVNRIFGTEAQGQLVAIPPTATKPARIFDNVENIDANVGLLNASYTGIKGVTLGAYAYLMEFEEKENWDNNTFGGSATGDVFGLNLYGEVAYQDKAGFFADDDAFYFHGVATKKFGTQSVSLGIEQLGEGFKTPLATVHAFNGWADVFAAGRIQGTHNGLTDVYASHTIPIFFGIKWSNILHLYGENEISTGYGWEYNSLLVKKFNDNFTAIAKFSFFESEGDAFITNGTAVPDTTRFSVELNYMF
ncbi:MAG: alginate export family protein [Luteolibacter sp.]